MAPLKSITQRQIEPLTGHRMNSMSGIAQHRQMRSALLAGP